MSKADERQAVERASLHIPYNLLLEALRHREQEFFRFLAFIGPAVGGFFLLIIRPDVSPLLFCLASFLLVLLLIAGAMYSLVLGYQYRYLTMEIAKLEHALGIACYVLVGWPRARKAFLDKLEEWKPWFRPPDAINFFFWTCFVSVIVFAIATIGWPVKGASASQKTHSGNLHATTDSPAAPTSGGGGMGPNTSRIYKAGNAPCSRWQWYRVPVGMTELLLLLILRKAKRRYWDKFNDLVHREPPEWGALADVAASTTCGRSE